MGKRMRASAIVTPAAGGAALAAGTPGHDDSRTFGSSCMEVLW